MRLESFTPRRLQIWMVGVPVILAIIYFAFVASPRYASQAIVAVRLASVSPTVVPGMISMTGEPTPLSYEDTLYLMEYIQSRTMLDAIDVKMHLRQHYEQPWYDIFGKLWPHTSQEWFLWYWNQRVLMTFDDQSGLLTIEAQAFDPKTALALQQNILAMSEQWVNDYSWRIAREQIDFAQKLTDASNKKLQDSKFSVVDFQTKYHLLDPVAQTTAANSVAATLQATLVSQQTTLNAMMAYMQPDTAQVQALRGQIAATQAQLNTEKLRTTAGTDADRLTTLNVQYSNLLLDETLALNDYVAAAAALQAAKIDASRKLKSLVIIEDASRPTSSTYPRWIFDMATITIVSVLLYTIVRLTIATILEHRD
jgi:capsular polysaccharide transport system permease protein